ncbi:MAG: polysaccharide biosynthesis protein [bacterium]|nr:polysaccharide biosynthesis protein [bacterium]
MATGFTLPRINSKARSLAILTADAAITAASLWTALQLRFVGPLPEKDLRALPVVLTLLIASRLTGTLLFRLNRWSFRFSGLTDGARVAMSGLFGTGLFTLALYLLRSHGPPRSVVVMELLLTTVVMAGVRFTPRLAWMYRTDLLRTRRAGALRALIVGAGSAGEMLLRDLQRSDRHNYQILGFVDDDSRRWGDVVGGKTILGGVSDLPKLAAKYSIDLVLIAIPRMPASRVREILTYCSTFKLQFKILPVSFLYLQERTAAAMLQDLSPQHLLDRDEVTFSHADAQALSSDRLLLVSGAAGSIGSEVCTQLLENGFHRLVMIDIDENGLYLLKRRFERRYPDRTVIVEVADVRDTPRLNALFALYRPRDVFHAAARKHVPLMESSPCEAVKTNVAGTRNLARAAHEYEAERFVYMSTDKAVRPTSVMGATKRLGEKLVQWMDPLSPTRFSVVRFGNVIDSAGSVVPVFREQIAAGGPVTVTHPEIRRFFMTISEAVGLVLRAAYGDYGQLCVLEMGEPIRILDLARHMITMSGRVPEIDVAIEFTGLRPGEKLYEELIAEDERVVQRVDRKIQVVTSPPSAPDLPQIVDRLEQAAVAEDRETVLGLLRQAVTDYRSLTPTAGVGRELAESPAIM